MGMGKQIRGLHHVTAIAGDPQRNLDFCTGALGLRLVKLTVNFDDPETYHFYFGDRTGAPGTLLTFFPWAGAPPGRRGAGQITVTSFAIPAAACDYWVERFRERNVVINDRAERFGEPVIGFQDPDGLRLELVCCEDGREAWKDGPVPAEFAIRGLHAVTLSEEGYERTERLLTSTLSFRPEAREGNRFRYACGPGGPGSLVDVVCVPDLAPGRTGVGTVHHVAWRARDEVEQGAWRREVVRAELNVTPVMERKYFRSIYFREPGGVLFEIATDGPGFAVDEALEALGTSLALPGWLEPKRSYIEARLPPLRLPELARGA